MTRRLLLAVAVLVGAFAAVVLFSDTAHAATGVTLPPAPSIPSVPLSVPPAVGPLPVPGLPAVPVPPIVVAAPPVPGVPRVVVRIVPRLGAAAPSQTPRPLPSAVAPGAPSTTGSRGDAW